MADWIDPRTRRSVAFYAFLSVALWDAVKGGLNHWNLAALAVLAGVGGLGFIQAVMKGK